MCSNLLCYLQKWPIFLIGNKRFPFFLAELQVEVFIHQKRFRFFFRYNLRLDGVLLRMVSFIDFLELSLLRTEEVSHDVKVPKYFQYTVYVEDKDFGKEPESELGEVFFALCFICEIHNLNFDVNTEC